MNKKKIIIWFVLAAVVFTVLPLAGIADQAIARERHDTDHAFVMSNEETQGITENGSEEAGAAEEALTIEKIWTRDSANTMQFPNGTAYIHSFGYVYVPNRVDESTNFVFYIPGGCGQYLLDYDTVHNYMRKGPNAIMVIRFTSGWFNKEDVAREAAEVLIQTAKEVGLKKVDKALIAGTSNGAYVAMKAAAVFQEEYDIRVSHVLQFDTGMNWDVPDTDEIRQSDFLTDEQAEILAKHRTTLVLFEQPGTGTAYPEIQRLVDAGIPVLVAECRQSGHDQITANGFRLGSVDWGMGELNHLDKDEYNLVWLSQPETRKPHSIFTIAKLSYRLGETMDTFEALADELPDEVIMQLDSIQGPLRFFITFKDGREIA